MKNIDNIVCINKKPECKDCVGTNLCKDYENKLRTNIFEMDRKKIEEIKLEYWK